MRPGIELLAMSHGEVVSMREGSKQDSFRGFALPESCLLPEVVRHYALLRFQDGEDWFWCAPRLVAETSSKQIVGSICFKNSPLRSEVEIGYGIAPAHAGKGYATEAARLMLAEAFAHPLVEAVTAETSLNNPASQRVLAKLGFEPCGLRHDPEDGELRQWRFTKNFSTRITEDKKRDRTQIFYE